MDFVGIEKLSLVDYDEKITCTLFTSGCNFRCPFCHNSQLVIASNNAKSIPFDEILNYLKKRQGIIEAICITGGEPTLMSDLETKIIKIRELGYLIKLDTNGSNPKVIKDLVSKKLIDYIAMDIKNCKEKYSSTVGIEKLNMENIIESVEFIKSCGVDYEFRTTLIDEYHTLNDIKKIAIWLSKSKKYYLQKFIASEFCIDAKDLHEVTKEKAEIFLKEISAYFDKVLLRGY